MDINELEGQVADLEAQIAHLTKRQQGDAPTNFEQLAEEIRKRDNCSRTEALAKARREAPEAFEDYQGMPIAESPDGDFDVLVEAEIRKGLSRPIAAQRVLQKYGTRPNAVAIAADERAVRDFEDLIDEVMRTHPSWTRCAAMSEARRRYPDQYAQYQQRSVW